MSVTKAKIWFHFMTIDGDRMRANFIIYRSPPNLVIRTAQVDGQVLVPTTGVKREGIQPVVRVAANGVKRAEIAVGESVVLTAVVDVQPGTGSLVAAAWDFDSAGNYPLVVDLDKTTVKEDQITVKTTTSFSAPGTFFPALRVASQRLGDTSTPYARIQNLGRVRVVVK